MKLSPDAKQRLQTVLNIGKTVFHWGFLPLVLYLGFQQGSDPGSPEIALGNIICHRLRSAVQVIHQRLQDSAWLCCIKDCGCVPQHLRGLMVGAALYTTEPPSTRP
ncbi:hypothetical protein O3P69_019291 [Scylla paramamosain]|uniref:Mitochondrial import receptor subunit TOM7 homolog n=1 Tax=Scylla paramamosain TaxID=85552 RepID=A0AAW0SX67_SCYPA